MPAKPRFRPIMALAWIESIVSSSILIINNQRNDARIEWTYQIPYDVEFKCDSVTRDYFTPVSLKCRPY